MFAGDAPRRHAAPSSLLGPVRLIGQPVEMHCRNWPRAAWKIGSIDEIGYLPSDRAGANLFFQLISRRKAEAWDSRRSFSDLSRIFAATEEPVYSDDCCHLNERGSELLAGDSHVHHWEKSESY